MYTISDLYEIVSLYYTQAYTAYYMHAYKLYYIPPRRNCKQLYAHRCLLYTIAANMIYEGRY